MKHDMIWAYLIHLSRNFWDEDPLTPGIGYHPSMDTDYETWRQVIDFLPAQGINTVLIDLGDAVQYETHPEISLPRAWSKEKLKCELEHMRSIGLTPLPKLNFSAGHDVWLKEYSRMVSTPKYYEVCTDLIREVAELFDYPKLFHLGMDEEDAENQATYQFCCIRQGDLWWHDLYFLIETCQKTGARPWVWADACWTYFGRQEEYLAKMPKSVLQSNWWYRPLVREKDGAVSDYHYQAYLALDKAGFDQVPTVSTVWGLADNAKQTMELAQTELTQQHVKGFMTAPWRGTYKENLYDLLNDACRLGQGKLAIYPDY